MIRLHCPVCGLLYSSPSLDAMIKEALEGWKKLEPTKEQWETIQKMNDKERLQKILDEKGYLEAICRPCMTNLFIKLLRKYGGGMVGA